LPVGGYLLKIGSYCKVKFKHKISKDAKTLKLGVILARAIYVKNDHPLKRRRSLFYF